jgi:hypothetical protein
MGARWRQRATCRRLSGRPQVGCPHVPTGTIVCGVDLQFPPPADNGNTIGGAARKVAHPWEAMRLQELKRHIRRITSPRPVPIFGRGTRLGRDSSQSSSAPAIADRPRFAQYATSSRSLSWPRRALWCEPRAPNPRTYRQVTRAPPLLPGNGGMRLIGCHSARSVTHPNQNQPGAHRDAAWR